MSWFRLRPTFEIALGEPRSVAIEKLEGEYTRLNDHHSFFMHGEYGELHLPSSQHRLWSPHLSFYVSEREGDSLILGRFAPRIEVWTFVWVVYLAMAFTAFFGLALAYSQWMLSEPAWGLAVAVFGTLAIVALYVTAHIGQQWSVDQMELLKSRLHELLKTANVVSQ